MWKPEMYELSSIPTAKDVVIGSLGDGVGDGVVGVRSGYEVIELFPYARKVLQDFDAGVYGDQFRIAAASSADTPQAVKIGRAAMGLLEVRPGLTMREAFHRGWDTKGADWGGNLQIGRSPPLSPNKAETHFPILQRETGVAYRDMLFFDDCNWGDHVAKVEKKWGVTGVRTPRGLTEQDWQRGLEVFSQRSADRPVDDKE
jgi:magnesium-dependent phosphatase 1